MPSNKQILARLAEAGIVESRETLKHKKPTGKCRGFQITFTHRELDKHPQIEDELDTIENFCREMTAVAEKSEFKFTKRDFILKAVVDAVHRARFIANNPSDRE